MSGGRNSQYCGNLRFLTFIFIFAKERILYCLAECHSYDIDDHVEESDEGKSHIEAKTTSKCRDKLLPLNCIKFFINSRNITATSYHYSGAEYCSTVICCIVSFVKMEEFEIAQLSALFFTLNNMRSFD